MHARDEFSYDPAIDSQLASAVSRISREIRETPHRAKIENCGAAIEDSVSWACDEIAVGRSVLSIL